MGQLAMDQWMEQWMKQCGSTMNVGQLQSLRAELNEKLASLTLRINGRLLNEYINQGFDCLIKAAVQLAQLAIQGRGLGEPPAEFDFILFGSAGRGELTLWSDLDNGLIFDQPDTDRSTTVQMEYYFQQLSDVIMFNLEMLGFPPCKGGVSCTAEQWRKPVYAFEEMIRGWSRHADWESVRYLLICADMRPGYGKGRLTGRLHQLLLRQVKEKPELIGRMLSNTLKHKVLIGIFGHFLKEAYGSTEGGIDIKRGGYLPMVNAIRLLSLSSGTSATSSLARLDEMNDRGLITDLQMRQWSEAFSFLLQLRNATYPNLESDYFESDGMIDLKHLSRSQQQSLKQTLRQGKMLQKGIEKKFARWRT